MEDLEKQKIIDEILSTKTEISRLLNNIRDTRTVCNRLSAENQYIQEYVGTLMKSNDVKI